MDISHLTTDKARQDALLSVPERRRIILADKWFNYDGARELMAHMEWLYEHPTVDRPPNMLLTGDSNSGKSALLKRLMSKYPSRYDPNDSADYVPILRIDMPTSCPPVKLFLAEFISALRLPLLSNATAVTMKAQMDRVLPKLGTKIIIIDEFQTILNGSPKAAINIRDELTLLSNRYRLPIILTGMDSARTVMRGDPQLDNRFEKFQIKRITDQKTAGAIVKKWLGECPLQKRSTIDFWLLTDHVIRNSGGLIGHMMAFLQRASEFAIDSGEESFTENTLRKMRWSMPKSI
ncbi:TniB family NTP-binding protein [Herbaspirillum rubrisubalbicans]|uniref:AAA+ ATPase domain-containing protein n=1 Tax=Herbaspirillum rubrisubalbicans TaxID=80842 RepID=A0AAD0U518_9BURK|nr:TniB family NTP-binding protein [Herbaspirillum rubrisubalbicans]AYR23368.1 hypothetical protein RC54_05810 [Herbaspirillum rubrisubalbicans]